MNKKLLGIFCVAAASLAASAQSIPSTYNYQGVCGTTNADVEVVFNVLANGKVVYSEAQTVKTNKDGAFTALVGNGAATVGAWDAIDWTNAEYSLETSVNGTVVANCAMVAVPYATVAERVLGMDQLNEDLQAMDARIGAVIETMADAIAEATEEATAANIKADTYYDSLKAEMEEVFTNIDLNFNNIDENATMTNELIDTMLENIKKNEERIEEVNGNMMTYVDGLQATIEEIGGNTQEELDKINALIANMDDSTVQSSYVINKMIEDIDAINAQIANMDENTAMANDVINTLIEKVDAIDEGLQGTDARYGELFEKYGEAIEAINAQIANMDESTAQANDVINTIIEDVDGLKDLTKDYNNIVDNLEMLVPTIDTLLEDVDGLKDLTKDYNNIVENLEGLVPVIETLTEDVAGLQDLTKDYKNIVDNLDMLVPIIDTLLENVDKNAENIKTLDDATAKALRKGITNETAIKDLQHQIDAVVAKADAALTIREELNDDIAAVDERINDNWEMTEIAIKTCLDQIQLVSAGLQERIAGLEAEIAKLQAPTTQE